MSSWSRKILPGPTSATWTTISRLAARRGGKRTAIAVAHTWSSLTTSSPAVRPTTSLARHFDISFDISKVRNRPWVRAVVEDLVIAGHDTPAPLPHAFLDRMGSQSSAARDSYEGSREAPI